MTDDVLLELGRIGKAHGLRGEVVVTLTTDRIEERTQAGGRLFVGPTRDDAVERVVAAARRHHAKWLFRFEGLDDRDSADALRGQQIYGVALDPGELDDDDDVLFVHELIGSRLIDQHGTDRGTVVSVIDNPAADLLELDGGALVPLTFVTEASGGRITVDAPDGLFDDEQ